MLETRAWIGAGQYAGPQQITGRAQKLGLPTAWVPRSLLLPWGALSSLREPVEPVCCHGRQTSQEQPVCLGSKALNFSRPPVTWMSNNSAAELGKKWAWEAGWVRPEGSCTAPRMGRQQVLDGLKGERREYRVGSAEAARGRMRERSRWGREAAQGGWGGGQDPGGVGTGVR